MNLIQRFSSSSSAAPALAVLLLAITTGCASAPQRAERSAAQEAAAVPARISAPAALAAGDTAYRRGDFDGALVEYVKALDADGKNPEAFYRVARTHEALGDIDTAADAYRKALAFNPTHAGANEGLGLILVRQKKLLEARNTLQYALQRNPALWRAQDGLGVIADLQGNYAQAQASYQKALTLNPESPQVLNNLGYSRYLAGQFTEAQAYFERALAAAPGNASAQSNIGLVQARLGHYPQAVAAFRELMPEPEAYYSTGYVCMLAHRWADAGQLFQRAIELSPSYYEAAHQNLERVRNEVQSAAAMPAGSP